MDLETSFSPPAAKAPSAAPERDAAPEAEPPPPSAPREADSTPLSGAPEGKTPPKPKIPVNMPEPDMRLYFLLLPLFALAAVFISPPLAAAEALAAAALYIAFIQGGKRRRARTLRYIDNVTGGVATAGKANLINSPLPTMVFRPDTGEIIWSNEDFLKLTGMRGGLFETHVEEAVPDFPFQWLREGKRECPRHVGLHGRRFRVYGSLVRSRGGEQSLVATTYWVETTESDALRERYDDTRPVLAILLLDNYEELMKACADTQRSALLAQIDEKLDAWAAEGLLIHTQRDRYLYVFEERVFQRIAEEKFAILDAIRDVKAGDSFAATLSIGVGKDAPDFRELYKNANLSLEMALSRGGDQAVVRSKVDFAFYGGRTKSTEKRTKVKSRVMANALSELMRDAEEVYIMGHSHADMDAVGAAAGMCCAARTRGKPFHVVIDAEHSAAGALLRTLEAIPEYDGIFLEPNEAFLKMRPGALLVVVDTNRPELVESKQILESCNRVAVIDHHRRAATYIENPAFSFHEPYASSAAELVTELLQYMVNPSDLLREEADALLAGIVLDTKHFAQRTSGRTFEAAAFLRGAGADTERVQQLFQSDLKEMEERYDIIRQAAVYKGDIAIAAVDRDGIGRVAASQAADELLTLKGVRASFVLYRHDDSILLSARSLGNVNVQVILEQLGGGGNSTAAGGRVEHAALPRVREQLERAIDAYLEN